MLTDHHEYEILMGTTMDASQCMVPALRQNLASEVGMQMMIDEERRMTPEEQELARQKPPKGAHGGAGGGVKD